MTKDEALKLALEALEEAWYHVGTFQPTEKAIDLYDEARAAIKEALAQPEQEPVAWEGGEGWESLAWELCADENGEDSCNELIWEGGPIPEPWGDRWMKYEEEAKRLIALVQKHTTPPQPDKNEFKPDWDEKLALTEEVIRLSKRIEELEAQPSVSVEQEPVAFVKGCNRGQWEIFPAKAYQIFEREQPLYTTPPQRKPLTDEEVEKIIKANMSLQMNLAGIRQDFEAAHGIKGEA
jgi:hypothetical protein